MMKLKFYILITLSLVLFLSHNLTGQEAITAKDLYKHIDFLASDSLKGRKPGTEESKIAAQYIADEFKHYGLKLLAKDGFQYFDVKSGVKPGDNYLKINGADVEPGKEYTVLSYSENVKSKSDILFLGYGFDINDDKLKWNDYQDVDVTDKWVVIFRGHPELDQRMSMFSNYADERAKILTAKDKGAIGVIFVSPAKMDEQDELIPLKMGRGDVKAGLPVIQVKRTIAEKIVNKSISALENTLNDGRKPISFDCKSEIEIKTEVNYQVLKTQNVIGVIEGNDPVLKNEYILVGAHYDHLGIGGPGSGSRQPDTLAIHNGADDNASGVATILEIAQKLAAQSKKIKRSILFIAFGAEESGLLGSQYFANHPLVDLNKIDAMLNFDMVGRLNSTTNEVSVGGTGTAAEWETMLTDYQKNSPLKLAFSKEGYGPSDHASFYSQNIPVLFFNTGVHNDYHTPADDTEFINFDGQEKLTKMGADLVLQLSTQMEGLHFQESGPKKQTSSREGMKVRLGIMPGFASTDNNGLKVEGVTKDGPAEKAGLLKGDLIISINGEKIQNIYDYMNRLKKFNPGDRISVDVLRSEEKKVFIVDL
ncbi:MAG: M20/M25/M40 family metallo-hydrolase [Bacteroidales bacterium]|nr:M20/M25/M40 family metallo-hydrolase [Bacteroidales bacterium]